MADRASKSTSTHSQAIKNLDSRRKQVAERRRLTDELIGEAEKVHREWISPKANLDRLRNEQRLFESQNRASLAEAESQVAATADPRIAAEITALNEELQRISESFSSMNSKERMGRKVSHSEALDKRVRAIAVARNELTALIYSDYDDVDGAIAAIESKIPPTNWS